MKKQYTTVQVNSYHHFKQSPLQIGEDTCWAKQTLEYFLPANFHPQLDTFLEELIETGGHNRGTYNTMELLGDFMIWSLDPESTAIILDPKDTPRGMYPVLTEIVEVCTGEPLALGDKMLTIPMDSYKVSHDTPTLTKYTVEFEVLATVTKEQLHEHLSLAIHENLHGALAFLRHKVTNIASV